MNYTQDQTLILGNAAAMNNIVAQLPSIEEIQLFFSPKGAQENRKLFQLIKLCPNLKRFVDQQESNSIDTANWVNQALEDVNVVLDSITINKDAFNTNDMELENIIGFNRSKHIQLSPQGWNIDVDLTIVNTTFVPEPYALGYVIIPQLNSSIICPPKWKMKNDKSTKKQKVTIKKLNNAFEMVSFAFHSGQLKSVSFPAWTNLFDDVNNFPFLMKMQASANSNATWILKKYALTMLPSTMAFDLFQNVLKENSNQLQSRTAPSFFEYLHTLWTQSFQEKAVLDNEEVEPVESVNNNTFIIAMNGIRVDDWRTAKTYPPLTKEEREGCFKEAKEKVAGHLNTLAYFGSEILLQQITQNLNL